MLTKSLNTLPNGGDANTTDQAANTGGEMVNKEVPAIAASEDPRESVADVAVDDDRPSEALRMQQTLA